MSTIIPPTILVAKIFYVLSLVVPLDALRTFTLIMPYPPRGAMDFIDEVRDVGNLVDNA